MCRRRCSLPCRASWSSRSPSCARAGRSRGRIGDPVDRDRVFRNVGARSGVRAGASSQRVARLADGARGAGGDLSRQAARGRVADGGGRVDSSSWRSPSRSKPRCSPIRGISWCCSQAGPWGLPRSGRVRCDAAPDAKSRRAPAGPAVSDDVSGAHGGVGGTVALMQAEPNLDLARLWAAYTILLRCCVFDALFEPLMTE